MTTTRYFGGSRSGNKRSAASEMMRFELQKKGKLPANERYKRILKKKLEESRQAAGLRPNQGFKLPGSLSEARKMSAKAEQAIKEIAMKKAAKQAKADRQMVIIQPRNYHNGSIDKKGRIVDIAGNQVGQVYKKNGKMVTMSGWGIGKYKRGSYGTNIAIQDAINKFSPYYINLRKMQAMQAGQMGADVDAHGNPVGGGGNTHMNAQQVINHYGYAQYSSTGSGGGDSGGGGDSMRGGIAAGVTSWGAMSDNVFGTFSDNVWGSMADNVWGGTNNNVWGGIGDSNWWGYKGPKIWGTGNGKNYISSITSAIAALFGFSNKNNRDRLRALSGNGRTGGASGRTAATPRTAAPTRSAAPSRSK